ncbi:putative C2H2 finger domain protein (Ezf) [Aspergillus ibericus CBS 121593]|uniref:C2H2 finger domain protein Ezf n=1 Tax=Aspergillus ibericus CBS 121593 TaxID=1448316 RepID=A0A395GPT0_9EURO|nr:C2H2 finger domain protein Ezf [Aspergillus ibericus CBS 121593]RAK97520.1 C2H2 finger domain protein Ezf [Aspergillus ibericus CBS 121593]
MDCTPTSFPSSPVARSVREDKRVLEANSTYSSPFHTVPLDRYDFQSFSGLGISNCETGSPIDQIRMYPCPEQYALSTSNWSGPITPSPNFLETPPDVSHFAARSQYELFGSRADVSVSPSYSSVMDFRAMHDEISPFWPNTPPSETMGVSEGWTKVEERPEDMWDASLLDGANNTAMSTVPQLPRLQINTAFIHPQRPDNTQTELDASPEAPAEAISKWIEDVSGSPHGEQLKIPSASGLECTTCGLRFTRRSNCREHMKSHDPSYVRQHPCETCGREFRRKTDLKRHIDSIHRGIRKYGCEKCGRRYSRQDTLSRHLLDGCDGRPRKSRAPRADPDARLGGSGPL